MDLDLKLVGATVPTPAFRALVQCAVRKSPSAAVLVWQDELERLGAWSLWRRGRICLPQLQTDSIVVPHLIQVHWGAIAVGWAA